MKPVNSDDLRASYRKFFLLFALLLTFSVTSVYFYFLTSDREITLLDQKVKESDRLISIRNQINGDLELIVQRLQDLSAFTKMSSTERNNQSMLLNDIQDANQHIKGIIQQNKLPLKSFEFYQKLSDHVAAAAVVKDSLFTTRFQIESARAQLNLCQQANNAAVARLRGRFGR
ncbi:putative transcriptional regulator YheO [Pedobacter sp. UYP30]|uniref:hypothetical protein n=1 Tax=Pedobacter sp. UYP30 TaxID=1756400 RepID=UPI00339110F9